MPHTLIDDADPDALISRLARPLAAADRQAFDTAARAALAHVPCWGEGALYRAVAALQRGFRNPPSDHRASWDIGQEIPGPSKLRDATAATVVTPASMRGEVRYVVLGLCATRTAA